MTYRSSLKFVQLCGCDRVLMEPVEARILLSSPSSDLNGDAGPVGTLLDRNSTVVGSATLTPDGLLTVHGTDAGEEIVLGMDRVDPTKLRVRIVRNDMTAGDSFLYSRAALTGIVVDAGAGDDYLDFLSWGHAVDLPVTLMGGAGNDGIEGGGVGWDLDGRNMAVDRSYVGDVFLGGAGNDTISSGLGPDVLDGGDGDDLLITNPQDLAHDTMVPSGGNDIVQVYSPQGMVEFPLVPPAPKTAPLITAAPAASNSTGNSTSPTVQPTPTPIAAPPPTTAPVLLGTNELLVSASKLWDV